MREAHREIFTSLARQNFLAAAKRRNKCSAARSKEGWADRCAGVSEGQWESPSPTVVDKK